jgi:hypothetical protein
MDSTTSTTHGVALDALVRSADGVALGRAKEIRRNGFKIDAQLRPDYWLMARDIQGVTPASVTMGFLHLDLPYHEVEDIDDPYA